MSKSDAAKQKILNHLHKYGHLNLKISNRKIRYWFRVINEAAFDGELPMPVFEFRNMRDAVGLCTQNPDHCLITIGENHIDSRKLFIATICHELVHQWQVIHENKMSHVGSYQKWKRYFKKQFKIAL